MKEIDSMISFQMNRVKDTQSTSVKMLNRIHGHGRGWVFTPSHFQDVGTRTAIDLALRRHVQAGTIRQLARGLYDYPREHSKLGFLTPSAEVVARALAGRDAARLQPAGGYAANLLGLSDQIPMKIIFLTDGPTRKVPLGKQTITLKRTTPKNMAAAGKMSGLVIQALRHLGQRHADEALVDRLRQRLSDDDKRQLLKDTSHAPAWVAEIMRRVATPQKAKP